MRPEAPVTIRLEDYTPPAYLIDEIVLDIRLDPVETRVAATLRVRPNPLGARPDAPLVLDGEDISLLSLALDGEVLPPSAYRISGNRLSVASVPQRPFTLETSSVCNPSGNTQLSGLYMSRGIYCTQCEAEGFRRIAFFPDRPDIMARYRVRMEAPRASCPVLLSNGNPEAAGRVAGTDRHFAIWDDPYPKPSYLFALVAGDLASVHDSFVTQEGRRVALGIHVEKGKEDRCAFAMESLKASMAWDERAFGRCYDLDVFNIVAVPDFNMGAMENKGLNIFNDKYVLARPDTATDADFARIEAIIAHEYFHNWTGNRVTCRDWFQLCLKEGLTVFRDQEFTADLRSAAVKRIADVKTLRTRQFPEDAGPLAHAVRPSSYMEINNFYTATVYEKGAELCRMLKTLLGPQAFRRAMDLFFEWHDGEAATVEDFLSAMADASGRDLSQFARWYAQAGTPVVTVQASHDAKAGVVTLNIAQETKATAGQPDKLPLHIPLRIGLMGKDGSDLPLALDGKGTLNEPVIELTEEKQTFRFTGIRERPVVSINRGFSAPVILSGPADGGDLLFRLTHESDSFNRWEAAQSLGLDLVRQRYGAPADGGPQAEPGRFAEALGAVMDDESADDGFKALMLDLPSEAEIAAAIGKDIDTTRIQAARNAVRAEIAAPLTPRFDRILAHADQGAYRPDAAGTARRALRHAVLHLLAASHPLHAARIAAAEFAEARHMTAEMSALSVLVQIDTPLRADCLAAFRDRHGGDHLLLDKWFMLQATIPDGEAPARVAQLLGDPDFTYTTPNRVYALLGSFTASNPVGFNAADGAGYRLAADAILTLDPLNPQVAARLATAFRSFRLYDAPRRLHAERELRRVFEKGGLSRDVLEIVSRTLGE